MVITRWQGFYSEHEYPTSTALEHLGRARCPDSAHVRAWRMGVNIAIVEPRSKSRKSAWPSFFLECRKYLKNEGHAGAFFNPYPPGLSGRFRTCIFLKKLIITYARSIYIYLLSTPPAIIIIICLFYQKDRYLQRNTSALSKTELCNQPIDCPRLIS